MKKSALIKAGAVIAISGGLLTVGIGSASAATAGLQPEAAQTIAPGSSGTGYVSAVLWNNVGTPETGTVSATLTAPSNSTFHGTTVWGETIVDGDRSAGVPAFSGCTLSTDRTQMTCSPTSITVPAAQDGQYAGLALVAYLDIDADAPADTLITDGSMDITGDGGITASTSALQYRTPAVNDTPIVAPVIAGGAAALSAGIAGGVALLRRKKAMA